MECDIAIIGAGPAGCSAAIKLAASGLNIVIVDKARFPRDKICGDALSVDVVNQLAMLSKELSCEFKNMAEKTASHGVTIYSPNGKSVSIPFLNNGKAKCGYIVMRQNFDYLLFKEVKKYPNVQIIENKAISEINLEGDKVIIQGDDLLLKSKLVIGADGAYSIVNKHLGKIRVDKKHYSAGLRIYYENLRQFHPNNYIELYFFKDILPGYLWVFPLSNNRANVGIGMLSASISAKRIHLRAKLEELLATHPALKDRFSNARALETIRGFGLPLGSKKRPISGERFLLTGDAAGLIDPFSGEGIANAIRSGRVAAEHATKCFITQDFSASFNASYDQEIYSRMWKEFKISRSLQNLCTYSWLFNFLVGKAAQSAYLKKLLTDALAEVNVKKVLTRPCFYIRLLFR